MPWKVFVMEKRKVPHLGEVPDARPFRFSGSKRGRLLHKEKWEKLGAAGPHHHQHRHSTWAKPVQQSPYNHKSSPRSVQETARFIKALLLTAQLRLRVRLRLEGIPRPRSSEGAWAGVPGEVLRAIAAHQSSGAWQQLAILNFPCMGHESASMAAAPSFSPSNKTDGWMGGC